MERPAVRTKIDDVTLERLLGLESSKIGYYADVKQKIHELETANLGLRNKSYELQAIFDSISDSVVIYDHNSLVQHRNHVAPRLFPVETVIGRHCRELFHPDHTLSNQSCPVERALSGERVELSLTRYDAAGNMRYFDVTVTPIEDVLADRNRALVFMRDVTEKRMQELQLIQVEKLSSIGVLAAGVAHEINNPLTSVAGYAEALLRRFRDEKTLGDDPRLEDFSKYLQVIIRESYRCKGIIDCLLSFSRKSDGSFGIVDINQIIIEVLELVRHKSRYEKIVLHTALSDDLPNIACDPSGVRQVIMNLLLNAHQAISDYGMVKIRTAQSDADTISVIISDDGCGIPKSTLDQIWDPFFTTKAVGQGLGLGLAVTYNIVKRHGGEIIVESTVGKGSTFTVRIPICQE